MSIEKIEVRSPFGALLTLTLDNPTNGYLVQDVAGLDPVKTTITSSTYANFPGAKYQSSRREARNIVIKIGLDPNHAENQTVRELRTGLYAFFDIDAYVDLRFHMVDGLIVDIAGRVETCEAPLFAQEPSMTISMLCFEPDFVALSPVVVNGNTVSDTSEFNVAYAGARVGLTFALSLNRSLSAFTIYHRGDDNVVRSFDFAASLVSGDILTVTTMTGDKAVILNRGGTISSLLYGKSPQSNWPQLSVGNNRFRVYATGAAIPFTMLYTPRYGGL